MTKAEILAFLDSQIEAHRQRWLVAAGHTRGHLAREGLQLKEVRAAIVKHVPADQASATQTGLKGIA